MNPTDGTQTQRRPRRDSLLVARCTAEMKALVDAEAARRDLAPADVVRHAIRALLEVNPVPIHLIRTQEEES